MRVLPNLLANLLRVFLVPLWLLSRSAQRKRKSTWVFLKLPKSLRELRSEESFIQRVRTMRRRPAISSIQELRELGDYVASDPTLEGFCVQIGELDLGWAACESVREVLLKVRGSGKRVVCYLAEGGGNRELYLATGADKIVIAPWSTLGPLGFATQSVYLKRLLSRLGVQVDVQSTGAYKSAAEPLVLDEMSDAAREQQAALLKGLQHSLEQALQIDRGLAAPAVEQLFARGMVSARDAHGLGVVDEVLYEDELPRALGIQEPLPAGVRPFIGVRGYLAEHRFRLWKPLREPPFVGVVSLSGTITQSRRAFARGADRGSVVSALRRAKADPNVRAVVLHIDSPGGSAFASELIHREVERLASKKPVVAYFGNVAASGGYYVAAACRAIVARSLTVTGSIGVVSAKPAIADLLDRLGVNAQVLRTAPHADMFSPVRRLSAEETVVLREHTEELYARFLEVVSTGRKRPVAEIEALAGGRVWSGRDALEHGLVDVLGGIERALEIAREQVEGLPPQLRDSLKLRVCSGKADGAGLPPVERTPASWLADLAFLMTSRNEPGAYYAWGLSGFFG